MQQQSFNPRQHLMQIKNKNGASEYLPVQWRLVWFRQECPEGTIETELVHLDLDKETEEETYVWNQEKRRSEKVIKTAKGIAIFRATVKDGKGGVATGTKMEKAASFPDYLEKSETGAVGRALAALGYGTQFAPELNEEHRIVDSPVESQVHGTRPGEVRNTSQSSESVEDEDAPATEQQLTSIRKLSAMLKKTEPSFEGLTFGQAKALIAALSAEYRNSRNAAKPANAGGGR